MPGRSSRRRYSPLQSDKHEITWSNLGQNASAIQTIVLAKGTPHSSKNIGSEVEIGSHIYGFYLEFHFSAETVTNPKVIHWKVHFDRPTQTPTSPALYYQNDRSQIIQRGMEMLPKDVSTVFKRILFVTSKNFKRIPDAATVNFSYICSSSETINACGIVLYKEIY